MMNKWMKLALIAACGTASLPSLAEDQLSVGGAIGYSQYVYKDYDNLVLPIPMVSYESDNFYVRGISAGYYLIKNKQHALALDVSYSPRQFDPDDTGNRQMKLLNRRHSTAMVGVRYRLSADWGQVNVASHIDALDESDGGVTADANYGYRFKWNQALSLTPAIGVEWHNDKFNRYYYGVSQREAVASGLTEFKSDSGFLPYVNLTASYQVNPELTTSLALRYTWEPSGVSDSPMVERDGIYSTYFTVTYKM